MTGPMEFEPAEPELIVASHLLRVACVRCGVQTLAAQESLATARCGPCLTLRSAELSAGRGVAGYTTPVNYLHAEISETLAAAIRGEHPPPELVEPWRDLPYDETPAPVLALGDLARGLEWRVWWSHAVGTGVHGATGRPLAGTQERYGLAFGSQGLRAVAVYVRAGGSWSWSSMWVWGSQLPHWGVPSLADLKAWLGGVDAEWYAGVREREANAELARIERDVALKSLKSMHEREGMSVDEICTTLGLEVEREEVQKAVEKRRGAAREGAS